MSSRFDIVKYDTYAGPRYAVVCKETRRQQGDPHLNHIGAATHRDALDADARAREDADDRRAA